MKKMSLLYLSARECWTQECVTWLESKQSNCLQNCTCRLVRDLESALKRDKHTWLLPVSQAENNTFHIHSKKIKLQVVPFLSSEVWQNTSLVALGEAQRNFSLIKPLIFSLPYLHEYWQSQGNKTHFFLCAQSLSVWCHSTSHNTN